MAVISISEKDRQDAESFLVTYLSEVFPDADFSQGSVTRDHTVGAISAVYALLRREIANVRNASSLQRITQIADPTELSEAVDSLVSNWFINRRPGRRATGTLTLHFNTIHEGVVPLTTRFVKTFGAGFRLNADEDLAYGPQDFSAVVSNTGQITSYTIRVPIIAEAVGVQYAVPPGPFSSATPFSPFFLFAENQQAFSDGRVAETPQDLLARLPDAITKRDLSTDRSIRAVLQENFPEVDRVEVLGMGSPGMRRDIVDDPTAFFRVHLGGHTDVYLSTPIAPFRSYEGVVGGVFSDNRRGVTIFRDESVSDWRTLVEAGDLLHIHNAGSGEPRTYLIARVEKYQLHVSSRQPFPDMRPRTTRDGASFGGARVLAGNTFRCAGLQLSALDVGRYVRLRGSQRGNDGDFRVESVDLTAGTATLGGRTLIPEGSATLRAEILEAVVDYSISNTMNPSGNKVSRRTTGAFSRLYQEDGVIVLPSTEGIYRVREVSIYDDATPESARRTYFTERSNATPVVRDDAKLEYQIVYDNALVAHSTEQFATLRLSTAPQATGRFGSLRDEDGVALFSDPGASFNPARVVGQTLRLLGAFYAENAGEFRVAEVRDSHTLVLTRPQDPAWSARAEGRLRWELSHPTQYNGLRARVVYDTPTGLSAVSAFVQEGDVRTVASDTLVRAMHPVYLSFTLRYTARPGAVSFLEPGAARGFLVGFINNYVQSRPLAVADIVTAFQLRFSDVIGYVLMPMAIDYALHVPDGRVIPYRTQDSLVVEPVNGTGLTPDTRLEDPVSLGITNSTVRYLSDQDLITIVQVT